MTESLYLIYQNNTIQLVGSLIFKSTVTADAMNRGVLYDRGIVDFDNKASWRYYKHLAGEYHAMDEPMQIISHDTQELISFTKTNLLVHKTTAHNYKADKRYVDTLIAQYSMQFNLIRGILYPIPINDAINAADGEILYYDKDLVEDNELTLIHDIQSNIDAILSRWYVEDYVISDELYPAVFYVMLVASLIKITLNQRLARCKTAEAHSYHIREYLASRNGLDGYIDMLTKKQLLWLYRNIDYIRANIGKQEILDSLIDNILTPRGIPVGEFRIEQNIETLLEDGVPTGEFVSFPINTSSSGVRDRFLSIAEMFVKERGIASGNEDAEIEALPKTTKLLARSGFNTLPTKVLESKMVDLGEFVPVILTDTLYHYWGYLSATGKYRAIIEVTIGGNEVLLPVKDAFVLYTYALYKAAGITLDEIPTFYADNILKPVRPSFNTLRGMTDKRYVSDTKLFSLLANIPTVEEHISTIGFYENISAIHTRFKQHRLQWAQVNDGWGRGMAEGAARHLYHTIRIEVASEATYTEWFNARRLDLSTVTQSEWEEAATELFTKATGWVEDRSLADIQAGLIGLVQRLTSYTIQWIYEINRGRIVPLDMHTLLPTNISLKQVLRGKIRPYMDYKLNSARVRSKAALGLPVKMTGSLAVSIRGEFPPPSSPSLATYRVIRARVPMGIYDVIQIIPDVIPGNGCPVDSQPNALVNLVVLDLTFDEATVVGIIDHSTFNRTKTLVADSHLTINNSALQLSVPSGDSYNGSLLYAEMPPLTRNYTLVATVELLPVDYATYFLIFEPVNSANYNFKFRIAFESNDDGDYFIVHPDNSAIKTPISTGVHKIEYRARGVISYVFVDDVLVYNWEKDLALRWNSNYDLKPVDLNYSSLPVQMRMRDLRLTNEYDGPEWWRHSILALNFSEMYPDQIQDKSPIGNPVASTDFGNIYYDLSIHDQDPCYRVMRMTRNREAFGGSAGLYVYPVYTEGADLSFEFTFMHTAPQYTSNHSGMVFEIQNGAASYFIAMEHLLGDQHSWLAFFVGNFPPPGIYTEGDMVYGRWLRCDPNVRKRYTVNLVGGVATVHVDGVLMLTGTSFPASNGSNQIRLFGHNSNGALGTEWEAGNVIVTSNYYLDPALTRVVKDYYSILPTIVPPVYKTYLLLSTVSDADRLLAFDTQNNEFNLNAIGFTPKLMDYNIATKKLALVANNASQVIVYDTSVTPWVGSIGPVVPNPIIGIKYNNGGSAIVVSYVNGSNRIVDRLYSTSDYTSFMLVNDQAVYTGDFSNKRVVWNSGDYYLYVCNNGSTPRVAKYDVFSDSITPRAITQPSGVSRITSIEWSYGVYLGVVTSGGLTELRKYSDYDFALSGTLNSFSNNSGVEDIVDIIAVRSDSGGNKPLLVAYASGKVEYYTTDPYVADMDRVVSTQYKPSIGWEPTNNRIAIMEPGVAGFKLYDVSATPISPLPPVYTGDMYYTTNNGPGYPVKLLYISGAAAPGVIGPPV